MQYNFYVYVLLNPLKPGKYDFGDFCCNFEPFYIGKGIKNRMNVHLHESHLNKCTNKLKVNIIRKILTANKKIEIKIIKKFTSEKLAHDLEKELISKIGKRIDKKGPLANITDGGEGVSGTSAFLGRHHTEEAKKKMSESKKGKNNPMYGNKWFRTKIGSDSFSDKMKLKLGGIERPTYVKEKISKTLKNYKWSSERNIKISETMKNKWKSGEFKRITFKGKNNPCFIHLDDNTIHNIISLYQCGDSIFKIHKKLNIGRKKIKSILIEKKII